MSTFVSSLEQWYKMEAVPRGICLIISNTMFKKDKNNSEAKELQSRTGSTIDRDILKSTFGEMQFEVRCHDNLTDKKLLRTMHNVAQEDHNRFDCFVCCIMSYGGSEVVYGVNGLPTKILSLTSAFKKKHCSSLHGKPKLFFIHAYPSTCEPENRAEENDVVIDCSTGVRLGTTGNLSDSHLDKTVDNPVLQLKLLPNEADFLLDYCCWARPVASGSCYIGCLTQLLKHYGARRDLVEILNNLNETTNSTEGATCQRLSRQYRHSLRLLLRLAPCPRLKEVRLMVMGKVKRGKSSVANTILGEETFYVNNTLNYNHHCDWHRASRDGRIIEITEMRTELSADEAARPLITVAPGPHAIILCFRCEQLFSPDDYLVYSMLRNWLGSHCSRYFILALSGLDNLTGSGTEDMLRNAFVAILRELPSPDRFICLDNSADWDSRREQGDRLLRLVDQVAHENGGGHFSNKRIRSFEEEIQCQRSRGRTREQVKERVATGDDLEFVFEKGCCLVM